MPTIANANIPTPKSWDEFEDIVLSATKLRWKSTDFFRNGRQGQRQDGVDVFGNSAEGMMIGVQCKNTIHRLSEDVVCSEIKKAESFEPTLIAVCKKVRTGSKIEKKLKVKKWEQLTQKI